MTMTKTPSFETHFMRDGQWVLKTDPSSPFAPAPSQGTPVSEASREPRVIRLERKPERKPEVDKPRSGMTRQQLLRAIEIEAGRTLVRGYPMAQLEAARRGRLGSSRKDSTEELEQLLAWYLAGDY